MKPPMNVFPDHIIESFAATLARLVEIRLIEQLPSSTQDQQVQPAFTHSLLHIVPLMTPDSSHTPLAAPSPYLPEVQELI